MYFRSFFLSLILFSCAISLAVDLETAKRAYHDKNYATAANEFAALADKGNAEAQLILGKMYMMGQGVPKDPELSAKWLRASALQGNADAEFFLGATYLLPQKDVAEGMRWLRLSAEQGMQDAQYLLGKAYLTGAKELPRDAAQGDMWLRLAAKDNKQFYQDELNGAERQMTTEEISRGKEMASAWRTKTPAIASVAQSK